MVVKKRIYKIILNIYLSHFINRKSGNLHVIFNGIGGSYTLFVADTDVSFGWGFFSWRGGLIVIVEIGGVAHIVIVLLTQTIFSIQKLLFGLFVAEGCAHCPHTVLWWDPTRSKCSVAVKVVMVLLGVVPIRHWVTLAALRVHIPAKERPI